MQSSEGVRQIASRPGTRLKNRLFTWGCSGRIPANDQALTNVSFYYEQTFIR